MPGRRWYGVPRSVRRGYAIYRGITTGLNDAFIIDNQTKEDLVAKDPKSAEIIKPVLRGRDIQRYQAQWRGKWLIATFPALGLNIDDYPAVRTYLLTFGRERLQQSGRLLPHGYVSRGRRLPDGAHARKKTAHNWYEIQDTCAYHEHFRQEKLFWADMAPNGRFAFSEKETYCNNKGYIMTGDSLKYLCAVLNSSIITWWVRNMAATTGMGLTEWTIVTVERLPIPKIGPDKQTPLVNLVDRVLQLAAIGREDAMHLYEKIDSLVCDLYALTEAEVRAVSER